MMRVAGVDLSMTSTGLACTDGQRINLARITSKAGPDTLPARSARLRGLAGRLANLIGAHNPHIVAIEAPAFGATGGRAHDRSGLWWLLVARLTGAGYPLVEVPPTVLKMWATGAGNADKDKVLAAAIRTWPAVDVDGNDTADALWLAALAARAYHHPIDPWPTVPVARARAVTRITWPDLTERTPPRP